MSVFHEGEQFVQQRAGVGETAAELGARVVNHALSPRFSDFLSTQPFVIVASGPPPGGMWASILSGPPGFARTVRPDRVVVEAKIQRSDPLTQSLASGPAALGLLVLDPAGRRRIRLNGVGRSTSTGLEVDVLEVFGNCPKYIQKRRLCESLNAVSDDVSTVGSSLNQEQRAVVERADTFFIASRHPERGADASHRGGRPGFVTVADDGASMTFPDYAGNNLFQTLGNLTVDPAIGLLFVDWSTGRALQLSGHAEIVWDGTRLANWPRARRLIDVRLRTVVDRSHASPLRWEFVEMHRFNPPVPEHDGASRPKDDGPQEH
ncbi:MAG TPA: pyridoxamine 5'-phosphate oxidase family protein [Solirubrobacteraceae bacterium]|nr:pyridoxamine 5'-phosphate oxidase family protein [Solirubrobacteraceae bacterium]